MKLFSTIAALTLFSFVFTACKDQNPGSSAAKETKDTTNIEQLSASFDAAWNKKDSAGVVNLIADDAIMISGRFFCSGKDSLIKKFVIQKLPVTSNLKVKFLQTGLSEKIAYETGTWTMQVNIPGKATFDQSGNYTFVWKKQADGKWKTSMLEIEDYVPEK